MSLRRAALWGALYLDVILIGCAARPTPPPVTPPVVVLAEHHRVVQVNVDKTFGAVDILHMELAVSIWNATLNGNVTLDMREVDFMKMPVDPVGFNVYLVDSATCMFIPDIAPFGSSVTAWANKLHGESIWIVRDRVANGPELRSVLMHEIGHLLGAEHTSRGLMTALYQGVSNCVDYSAASQVAWHLGVSVDTMNYCEAK